MTTRKPLVSEPKPAASKALDQALGESWLLLAKTLASVGKPTERKNRVQKERIVYRIARERIETNLPRDFSKDWQRNCDRLVSQRG
jgi:hypothetical protein